MRDFVAWIDQIQVSDAPGTPPTITDFEKMLRSSVVPASASNPAAYFQFGAPLNAVKVHPADLGVYLRSAFRIWVTEIRPLFHAEWATDESGCTSASETANPLADSCLLLAEVDVPVVNTGPGATWTVDSSQPVTIDESRRPFLLHARMQQEWSRSSLAGGGQQNP